MTRHVVLQTRFGRVITALSLAIPLSLQSQLSERTFVTQARPQQRWIVAQRPSLSVGGAESGAKEFTMVTSTFRLPGERVAVALMGDAEIRVFDKLGTYVRTVGRKGRGPGEFPVLWTAFAFHDSIFGRDASGITQVFGPDGKNVRTEQRASAFGRRIEIEGYFVDGSLIARYYPEPFEGAPTGESVYPAMLVLARNGSVDSLFRVPAGTIHRVGSARPLAVQFSPRLSLVTLADRFCLSASAEYLVDCYSTSGEHLLRIRRTDVRRTEITRQDIDRFFLGEERVNPGPRAAPLRAEIRALTQFAKTRPAIGRLVASRTGELWVGSYDPAEAIGGTIHPSPDSATVWHVYSALGDWIAQVETPPRFRLFEAGDNWLLGVRRDQDDVEHVELYTITR